jgi:lipopolysaccharide transport system permease protein
MIDRMTRMTEEKAGVWSMPAGGQDAVPARRPRTVLEPRSGWAALDLRELWTYQDLLWMLVVRDLKLRYNQAVLGILWVLLQPLLAAAILALIFGRFASMRSEQVPYLLFLFTAMVAWTFFSGAVQRASNSLVTNSQLITKIYFPRLLIPLAHTVAVLLDFIVMLAVLAVLMLFHWHPLTLRLLALPFFALLMVIAATGVSLWLSALSVKYRDFVYVVPFMIQIWFFASPVIYSTSKLIPERWQLLYSLNPAVGFVEGFRWSILGMESLTWQMLLLTCGVSGLIFVSGAFFFRRVERGFADTI